MNPNFAKMVDTYSPQLNQKVAEGLAYHSSDQIIAYIDGLFRNNAVGYPTGLSYLGYEKATPAEGHKVMTRIASRSEVGNTTRSYGIGRNDLRVVNFLFKFKEEIIKKGIYLPYIGRFGSIHLNNVKYVVSPVLSDGIVTVKPDAVFVKLLKTKLWVRRLSYKYYVDGNRDYTVVYHSEVHNNPSNASVIRMKCTLVHYLCCKYGLTQTLKLFGVNKWKLLTQEEYHQQSNDYSREEWVTIESCGEKPRTYGLKTYYPNQHVFLVDRTEFESDVCIRSVFGTLVYILDHYTLQKRMNAGLVDDVDAWRHMMGETIHSSDEHYSIIKERIDKHMHSLDGYVDGMVRTDFVRIGLPDFDNIYSLFHYIVVNFNRMVSNVNHNAKSNMLYGKQLQVLQYLLFDLAKSINVTYYKLSDLKSRQLSHPDEPVTIEAIHRCLNNIRPKQIVYIKSHAEINPVEDPGDLPPVKTTRTQVEQEKSDRGRTKNTKFSTDDPRFELNASLVEAASTRDMTKADPSGRSGVNPYITLNQDNVIIPNPALLEVMEKTQRLLDGK